MQESSYILSINCLGTQDIQVLYGVLSLDFSCRTLIHYSPAKTFKVLALV